MNETNHNQAAPAPATDEREAFEAWALRCAVNVMYCEPDSQYLKTSTELLWQCWQARAALAATPEVQPWDGKLSDQLQRAINDLHIECKPAVVRHLEFAVRSELAALSTSYATAKRMYAPVKAEVQAEPVAAGEYLPLPMQVACSGLFPVYSAEQMRTYADAHRNTTATGPGALPTLSPQQQVLCTLLDTVEAMLGGPNGPTIQIRAALMEAPAAPAVDAETIHLQDLKNALADCKALRQQLTLMDEQQAGSVWRWQADGQDQLESMGNHMGVLIRACDLRALLAGCRLCMTVLAQGPTDLTREI